MQTIYEAVGGSDGLLKVSQRVAHAGARGRSGEPCVQRWQKYTERYVLNDPNAIRTITLSEFDVSIVNPKLVLTIPELSPGSIST